MANDFLRDRINRKLANLPDERLYQVLDFVEFLESRYAQEPAAAANVLQRFAEGVEDRLRAGRVSTQTIAETMNLMHRAMGVLNGVAAAGRSVADDLVGAVGRPPGTPGAGTPGAGSPAGGTGAAGSAGDGGARGAAAPPPSAPPPASPASPPQTPPRERPE